MKLLKTNKKLIEILVNGQKTDLVMKLGSAGEAFFVQHTTEKPEDETELTSPIPSDDESNHIPAEHNDKETSSPVKSLEKEPIQPPENEDLYLHDQEEDGSPVDM